MKLILPRLAALLIVVGACALHGQQPVGVSDALGSLADQPGAHFSFTFDRSMLDYAGAFIDGGGLQERRVSAQLHSITVETYHYQHPAFYTPEAIASLVSIYHAAGWKHLVDANASPAMSAHPSHTITDLWLHFNGGEIDDVTVLVRGSREMNLIQIACALRPLDLLHLSGHFGIPKVDPGAVMVPAPDGR